MTLQLRIDASDPTPPFEQLRRQLDEMISTGALVDGERLPSVRQLAADLSLAVGTVARAYAELEKGGFVLSRRGAGTRVTAPSPLVESDVRDERLTELVAELARHANALGMTPESITATLARVMRTQH